MVQSGKLASSVISVFLRIPQYISHPMAIERRNITSNLVAAPPSHTVFHDLARSAT